MKIFSFKARALRNSINRSLEEVGWAVVDLENAIFSSEEKMFNFLKENFSEDTYSLLFPNPETETNKLICIGINAQKVWSAFIYVVAKLKSLNIEIDKADIEFNRELLNEAANTIVLDEYPSSEELSKVVLEIKFK